MVKGKEGIEKDFFLTEGEVLSEIEMAYYDWRQQDKVNDFKQYIEENTKVFTQDGEFDRIFNKFMSKVIDNEEKIRESL